MPASNMRFPWVNANDRGTLALTDSFTHVTDGRDCCSGAHLYHYDRFMLVLCEEAVEAHLLTAGAVREPGVIAEHEDVRSGRA